MHKLKPLLTGRIVLALTVAVFVLIILLSLTSDKYTPSALLKDRKELLVGNTTITVEIADTDESLIQGLSGRESLAENSGMYFDLGGRRVATFWMREMLFPLDIIWIDDGTIVGVEEDAPVPKNPDNIPTFTSPQPVTHVLEVNSGFTINHHIEIGDKVEFVD